MDKSVIGRVALRAGDMATVPDTGITVTHGVDVARELAWTEGRLVFDRTPLVDALPALERWYGVDIAAANPRAVDGTISGCVCHRVGRGSSRGSSVVTLHARVIRDGRRLTLIGQ